MPTTMQPAATKVRGGGWSSPRLARCFIVLGVVLGVLVIWRVLNFTLSRPKSQINAQLEAALPVSMRLAAKRDADTFTTVVHEDPCESERVKGFKEAHRDDWVFWSVEQQSLFKMLQRAKAVLDGATIPFWLTGSTLLGWYRECGMLENHHDMDVALFRPRQQPHKIIELLTGEGANFTFVQGCGCEEGCGCKCRCNRNHPSRAGLQYTFEWKDPRHGIPVQLHMFFVERALREEASAASAASAFGGDGLKTKERDGRLAEMWEPLWDDERALHCVYNTRRFVVGVYGKSHFWVPADIEHYLSKRYGAGWLSANVKHWHGVNADIPHNCYWPQHLAQPLNASRLYEEAEEAKRSKSHKLAVHLYRSRGLLPNTNGKLWNEETFYALFQAGSIMHKRKGPAHEMLAMLLASYERRNTRAEPLYLIARHYRDVKQYRLCYLFAKQATSIRFPRKDVLMSEVDKSVYLYQVSLR